MMYVWYGMYGMVWYVCSVIILNIFLNFEKETL